MTTNNAQHLTAQMKAVDFVMAFGEELPDGNNARKWIDFFTQMLISFEEETLKDWNRCDPIRRLHLARVAAETLLEHPLESFNRTLFSHDRFEWRMKFTRLIQAYISARRGRAWSAEQDAQVDHYLLVHDAICYMGWSRGFKPITDIDDGDDKPDDEEEYIFSWNPN